MEGIKLFGLIVLGILVSVVGCSAVDASDRITTSLNELVQPEMSEFDDGLEYFGAKLEYFENVVEILTTEALEPDADVAVIRSESEALLGRIEAEEDNLLLLTLENFKYRCVENGGAVVEEYGSTWCSNVGTSSLHISELIDSFDYYGVPTIRSCFDSNRILFNLEGFLIDSEKFEYFSLSPFPGAKAIEYLFFNSPDDFDEIIRELEADLDELESKIDTRLTYLEVNDPELWYQVNYCQHTNWGLGRLVVDISYLGNRLRAAEIGIELNPEISTSGQRRRVEALRFRFSRLIPV